MNILRLLRPKSTVTYLLTHQTVEEGLQLLRNNSYTALPVITEDGQYCGTVSEGDFLWKIVPHGLCTTPDLEQYFIADLIRPTFNPAVKINITMEELLLRVMDQNFLPVVDDRDTFVGIVTRRDIIKYFYDKETNENDAFVLNA